MQEINITDIVEEISALVEEENLGGLTNILADLHEADIADLLQKLPHEERQVVFDSLDDEKASDVLAELDEPFQKKLLKDETPERIVEMIENLDSDDAADIVGDLPEDKRREVLAEATGELKEDLSELLHYDEETAGGLMALELISLKADQSVIEAIQEIRKERDSVEDLYHIYVIDEFEKLVGYLSLKDLVLANPDVLLKDIMSDDVIAVNTDTDQEEVAATAKKYDLVSLPVVDLNYRLVGRITADDIMDVMEEEASEDINKMAGLADEFHENQTIWKASVMRMPWLAIGMVGELVSAMVLSHFQATLQEIVILAFFIPLIMATGGNSGIQSSSIVVRGLALGNLTLHDVWKKVVKELFTSVITGVAIATALFVFIYLWMDDPGFALVLALVLNLIIIQAAFFGTIIPFTLKRLGFDPAIATGPFITTSNDVLGLIVYFTVMTLYYQ